MTLKQTTVATVLTFSKTFLAITADKLLNKIVTYDFDVNFISIAKFKVL